MISGGETLFPKLEGHIRSWLLYKAVFWCRVHMISIFKPFNCVVLMCIKLLVEPAVKQVNGLEKELV